MLTTRTPAGKRLPQIGENFRPGETAFIDERIQEAGAIENLHGLRRLEIRFESGLLLLADLNLPLEIGDVAADVAIGAPRLIGLL